MKPQEFSIGCETVWCEKASGVLLNLSSELLVAYPWFLRLSLILFRFVQ